MTSFQYGAINAAEALRLSERGVHRDQVVADVKRCRDRYESAGKTAAMLNIGESSVYGVVAGTSAVSATLLDGLYGPAGKVLLARHETNAATAAQPASTGTAAVVTRSDASPALSDASPAVVADRGVEAVAPAPLPEPVHAADQLAAANDDADWLDPALAALDRRLHHLCAVEADALTLLGRARAEMTKLYNARTLLTDLADEPLPEPPADAQPDRIAAE